LRVDKIKLSKEHKQAAIKELKVFFAEIRGEELSDFQGETLLELFLKEIGPYIYNQGIHDAYRLMTEKIEELYGLEKRRFKS
jgi:uncharacterized protein (DUF2164 family)